MTARRRARPKRNRKRAQRRSPNDLAALAIRSLKDALDSMNEMSETTSLRLQMTMDRRSKFIETLSNLLRKISIIEQALVKNMK
jgi:hypothetical protein